MVTEDNCFLRDVKRHIVNTAWKCVSNHIPSSLSCLEILYTLYTKIADITKENASDLIRDRVILSKEHARLGQVCLLEMLGLLPEGISKEWQQNSGRVGHDMFNGILPELAPIDVSSSSLGMGIGLGIGYAIAAPNNHIYVVVGDGELQEGSCWEGLMYISQHKMKNITIIVDRNYIQIEDFTKNIIDTSETLNKKLQGFDFDVIECDGHDVVDIERALKTETEKPRCIIANTVKAKEVMFLRDEKGCTYIHGWIYSPEEYQRIIEEIK